MEIVKTREENNFTVTISGRLDTMSSPQLQTEMEEVTAEAENLVLDLKDLEYISSAGLRVILLVKKAMDGKGSLTLRNVSDTVMAILDVTGFSSILTIEPAQTESTGDEGTAD